MAHSFDAIYFHVVFGVPGRMPLLAPEWRPQLWAQFGRTATKHRQKLVAAGGVEDHVHLLVSMTRTVAPCDIVRKLKASSIQWITGKKGVDDFAWQSGYGIFSVSRSQVGVVRGYLAKQEEHPRRQDFGDEFRELLKRHEIDFDERDLFAR